MRNAFLVTIGLILIGCLAVRLSVWWQGKRLATEVELYAAEVANESR